jgi:TolA-binding protein
MSRHDSHPEPLLRQLAEQALPSHSGDQSPERRERFVRGMKDAVGRAFERGERKRRYRQVIFGVAAAAAIGLLGFGLAREGLEPSAPDAVAGIESVSGTVVLTQNGAGRVVGTGERALHHGDALQTAAGARARLRTSKAEVNLGEATELRLSQPNAAEERISLRRGRIDVAVDKTRFERRSVVVETPDAEVVVRGTVFDVRVEPSSSATVTHVHVTQGSVWVLARGVQVALLSAGQSWSSGGATSATPAPAPTPEEPPPAATAEPARSKAAPVRPQPSPGKPGTLAEENRLFSAAVEARNRGEAARAAELFGELLATYPQSPLREVAQVERFRALSSAGQTTRAAAEARRYLAEHADGVARREARALALDAE